MKLKDKNLNMIIANTLAAVGSARATQRPAVACITFGVGGLNMLNAVACAYAEKTPLIVISGGPGESEKARDIFLHHTVKDSDSQKRVYDEVTQVSVVLDSPKTASSKIRRALQACKEFSQPVYIEIPRDMVDQKILVPGEDAPSYPVDEDAVREAAEEIISRIAKAERPVILAGVETERFFLGKTVLGLAEKLDVPVAYVRATIEITVLVLGFLLGGPVGVGTAVVALTVGYSVQFFFKLGGFSSQSSRQRR